MNRDESIYVAGHGGLVGSAICRRLSAGGFGCVLTRTRRELDLCDGAAVEEFFAENRPARVFLAAAKVGGILANDRAKVGGILANDRSPADFIRENLLIQTHVIAAAHRHGAKKLLFLGSSCIYPKHAPQPMREEHLLTGPLEPTNSAYAVAKIAGIEMCNAYRRQHGFCAISLMPTNLYGPGDNFDLEIGHVLPALIRKMHEAKAAGAAAVTIWGSGSTRREFLYADDLAEASVFLMEHYDEGRPVNVGVGEDITIRELAELVGEVVGYQGELRFDTSKPDGAPRKLLDVSFVHGLGWRATVPLREGIGRTYAWYRDQLA